MHAPHPARSDAHALELADIFRDHGAAYRDQHRLSRAQLRTMRAITVCRTASLGGHIERCDTCGAVQHRFHSCRNRHCPKCQTLDKERWVRARVAELLPVPYFHIVFTLPHRLNPLAFTNQRLLYNLLFKAAAETLQGFGRNPRWLGGEIGFTMVLHTWSQQLNYHLHVHCVVTGGALGHHSEWIPANKGFLFRVEALSKVFRAKYLDQLNHAYRAGLLRFAGNTALLDDPRAFNAFLNQLAEHPWVVYAKRPLAGPEQVLDYLGRYTHRIAISNHRLLSASDTEVRFRYRDRERRDRSTVMALAPDEFITRFLAHVLPPGFQRLRHFGILANRCRREALTRARQALAQPPPPPNTPETVEDFVLRVAGIDIHRCPHCRRGRLIVVATLLPDTSAWRIPFPTGPPS